MISDDDVIQLAIDRGLVSSDRVAAARAKLNQAASSPLAPGARGSAGIWMEGQVLSATAQATMDRARRGTQTGPAGTRPSKSIPGRPAGLFDVLRGDGALNARQLTEFFSAEFDLPVTELEGVRVPPETLQLVPRALAERHGLLPLSRDGERLRVAVGDPFDTDGIDGIRYLTGLDIVTTVAPVDGLHSAIEHFYGGEAEAKVELDDASDLPANGDNGDEVDGANEMAAAGELDAPIITLVRDIIEKAVLRAASDIHFEPLEKRFRVRYRIDGALIEAENPPKRLQAPIISRLKIMANISIAEKRIPQDGRIQVVVAGRSLDLRVSSLPTAHGESIVMRILDKEGLKPGLAELGFSNDDRRLFEQSIKLPDGILLVTGPTGSGKTTTLYSCLHHLNQTDRKIITVEDPVEYQLTGINQVPVRQEIGMTFASALRAMLRQAPNIVMVGEIRDRETAEIAINASLTGHMVFSTLHTNDAPGAVVRLMDMGVKPFLVSTSLRAVLAQRLVRKNCPACTRPHQPQPEELQRLNITAEQAAEATFMKGRGCAECHGTGYRGRMGIFELLIMNDELRMLVHAQASALQLRERARSFGLRSLREDGIGKVIAGLTTIEEVVSITVDEAN